MRMSIAVEATGVTTATVILTQEQVDELRGSPGRSRVPLAISYGGNTFRTSISIYRGRWMMVVNKEMRDGGLVPGDSHDVDVVIDTAERTVEVPADLASALDEAGLREAWDGLSHSHRKEHVRSIEDAKKPETRERRVVKALDAVRGG